MDHSMGTSGLMRSWERLRSRVQPSICRWTALLNEGEDRHTETQNVDTRQFNGQHFKQLPSSNSVICHFTRCNKQQKVRWAISTCTLELCIKELSNDAYNHGKLIVISPLANKYHVCLAAYWMEGLSTCYMCIVCSPFNRSRSPGDHKMRGMGIL